MPWDSQRSTVRVSRQGIDANERSARDATASIGAVIEAFAVELSRDDLDPEERLQIVKTLGGLPALKVEMHMEGQAFILRAPSILGGSSSRPVPAP